MTKVVRNKTSGAVQLSANFYLSEFIESDQAQRYGLDNTPSPMLMPNLFKLAELMEEVRKVLGNRAISVSSGYRSPAVNAKVGGSKTSDHLRGAACDFRCYSFGTPLQIATAIAKSGIKFGQLIQEGTWVHISLPNGDKHDGQVMTAIFKPGQKTEYRQGL